MSPQELVERALGLRRADGLVVIVDEESTANLRWAGNSVTTNGATRSRRLTVIATVAGRQGTAAGAVAGTGTTEDELESLVRAAERAAGDSDARDDAQPLVEPRRIDTGSAWDDVPAETSPAVFADVAPVLGELFHQARAQDHLLFGYAEHEIRTTYLGTSTGLRLRHDQPSGKLELNAKSSDYGRSAWIGRGTRDFTDVDVASLYAQLDTRLKWARRQVTMPAGRYETLLSPTTVADLMIHLYLAASGLAAVQGRSVFARTGGTRVGERLTDVPLTLYSDPAEPGLECCPFVVARTSSEIQSVFDNGVAAGRVNWIENGALGALLQTRYSAEQTRLPMTPFVDNLVAEVDAPSAADLDDLVARTRRGLLVNRFWYIRTVDPQNLLLTGLTRDGVYLVEDGEVVGAVNNFRFNESPVSLLSRIIESARSQRAITRWILTHFTRTAMPSLRVADFNMSTVSDAS